MMNAYEAIKAIIVERMYMEANKPAIAANNTSSHGRAANAAPVGIAIHTN